MSISTPLLVLHATPYFNEISLNPVVLLIVRHPNRLLCLVCYIRTSEQAATAGKGVVYTEVLLWGVFVLLVLLNGMSYIFNIDITTSIKNLFTATPEVDIVVDSDNLAGDQTEPAVSVPEIKLAKQVFHVPGNSTNTKTRRQSAGIRSASSLMERA